MSNMVFVSQVVLSDTYFCNVLRTTDSYKKWLPLGVEEIRSGLFLYVNVIQRPLGNQKHGHYWNKNDSMLGKMYKYSVIPLSLNHLASDGLITGRQ